MRGKAEAKAKEVQERACAQARQVREEAPGQIEARGRERHRGYGQLTVLPATHDEWTTLDYGSGGQIG